MSAIFNNSETEISQALAPFDVGELLEFRASIHGIENANYFIKARKNDRARIYVLTFIRQRPNAGDLYSPMMNALYQHGLPVAPPLQRVSDPSSDKLPVLLQTCLSGNHTVNPIQRQIEGLGRFTARMHLCMSQSGLALPAYPRTPKWMRDTIDPWLKGVSYTNRKVLEETINKVDRLLQRGDVISLPRGMIHGDLFRDNVLFNERGLTGVLDFHHASSSYWLFDLAVIANDWCTDSRGRLDPDRTRALLKSYHQIRRLTEQELWFFSSFTLYAALCFWVSRLTVNLAAKSEKGVRSKNSEEFKRIVVEHIGHPLYLDPRIFDIC